MPVDESAAEITWAFHLAPLTHVMREVCEGIASNPSTSNLHTKIVGHRLELVPLDDPFTMKPGESLREGVF